MLNYHNKQFQRGGVTVCYAVRADNIMFTLLIKSGISKSIIQDNRVFSRPPGHHGDTWTNKTAKCDDLIYRLSQH